MKIFMGGRQGGKTTALVEAVKKDPRGVLVVRNFEQARSLHEVSELSWNQVCTVEAAERGALRGRHDPHLYIDDAEGLIERLLYLWSHGQSVRGVAVNGENSLRSVASPQTIVVTIANTRDDPIAVAREVERRLQAEGFREI